MLGARQGDCALTRWLSAPRALFVGEISYSIYVWSFMALLAFGCMLNGWMPITQHYIN